MIRYMHYLGSFLFENELPFKRFLVAFDMLFCVLEAPS